MRYELHLTALRNDTESLRGLLSGGTAVDTQDPHGRTATMMAARFGSTDALRLLVERGADLTRRSGLDATALSNAVEHGQTETAAILLQSGADPNETYPTRSETTPLMLAAFRGDFAMVATLVSFGADVNRRSPDGYTALHKAAVGGDKATVQLLLEAGAEIDIADLDGDTPLLWAIWENKTENALLLLDRGANPHLRNGRGRGAMDYARESENMELMDRLTAS